MADYKKMYTILCDGIDRVADALEKMPSARSIRSTLISAQLKAEDVYIETSPFPEEADNQKIIQLKSGK